VFAVFLQFDSSVSLSLFSLLTYISVNKDYYYYYATDGQTDGWTKAMLNAPFPMEGPRYTEMRHFTYCKYSRHL